MPQMVAILHSFVGAAAVLVGIATALNHSVALSGVEARIHEVEIFVGVFVGAVTFTGSVVAYGKLQGLIGSKPLLLPGRHVLNLIALQLGEYRFTLRYGAVVLIKAEEYRPRRILRMYDVSDVVRKPRDFPAPRLGLGKEDTPSI